MSLENPQTHWPEKQKDQKIDSIKTSRGSNYFYLPDGTTKRYKTAEQKEYEPQSAIVFVPDYQTIKKSAPSSFNVNLILGENETQYIQTLLERVQHKGSRNYIVNIDGKKIESNEAIQQEEGQIFLTFGTKDKIDFYLPVSKVPKIGYYTFDTKKYYDAKEGVWKRERHLGNSVLEIKYRR
jgi:hypothetical protein